MIGGTSLTDVASKQNTVFGGVAGQFADVILTTTAAGGEGAGLGTYDVVVDECQNGAFDLGQDTVVRNAFRVDLDLDVPGFDTGLASFAQMKRLAGSQARSTWEIKKMLIYADVTEHAKTTAKLGTAIVGGLTGMLGFAVGQFTDQLMDPQSRSEEHTSELQSLMRISYAVFCLNKKNLTIYIFI